MFKLIKRIKNIVVSIILLFIVITIGVCILGAKYPIGYKNIIVKYSEEYNLDPYLVATIISIESKFNKDAVSNKDARGLMQISPSTGKWGSEALGIDDYNEDMLFDPETNIRIGTWYLNTLLKEFDDNLDLVLAAYNAGSGNVNKWLKDEKYSINQTKLRVIPFKETEDYLTRAKENYNVYSKLYKRYIMSSNDSDSLYINLLHNIRKVVKGLLEDI